MFDILLGNHAVQLGVQFRKLFGRAEEVIAAAGAARGIGAVADVHAPGTGHVGQAVDFGKVLAGNAGVEHDVVVPECGQAGHQIAKVRIQAGIAAEGVVPVVGKVEADGELVHAGGAQLQILGLGHVRPVGHQDGVGDSGACLDVAHDVDDVVAHERFATGNLDHTGAQHLHVAAIVGRPQIAGFVARAAMIAMLAVAGAGVGDLEGDDDGAAGGPVGRTAANDAQRVKQRNFSHSSSE